MISRAPNHEGLERAALKALPLMTLIFIGAISMVWAWDSAVEAHGIRSNANRLQLALHEARFDHHNLIGKERLNRAGELRTEIEVQDAFRIIRSELEKRYQNVSVQPLETNVGGGSVSVATTRIRTETPSTDIEDIQHTLKEHGFTITHLSSHVRSIEGHAVLLDIRAATIFANGSGNL